LEQDDGRRHGKALPVLPRGTRWLKKNPSFEFDTETGWSGMSCRQVTSAYVAKGNHIMKMLLATVALAAVIASPALAQRDQQNPPANPPVMTAPNAQGQPPGTVGQGTPSPQKVAPLPQHNGVPDSKELGTDPDPRIRQELPRSNNPQ
jgi:hypothetical protein